MRVDFLPFRVLLLAVSGWVHREQIGNRRLRLTDEQRRRLAAKGIRLGRRILERVASIVALDAILRWHRNLIAAKWTFAKKKAGRPGIMKIIRALILRMARENRSWGYCRIQDELKNLEHRVAKSTVRNVLKEHGILPAPQRPTSCSASFPGSTGWSARSGRIACPWF